MGCIALSMTFGGPMQSLDYGTIQKRNSFKSRIRKARRVLRNEITSRASFYHSAKAEWYRCSHNLDSMSFESDGHVSNNKVRFLNTDGQQLKKEHIGFLHGTCRKEKLDYDSYDEAKSSADRLAKRYCTPFWVYAQNNGSIWNISSHGFDTIRSPDSTCGKKGLVKRLREVGIDPHNSVETSPPSATIRARYNGNTLFLNGMYVNEFIFQEWLNVQKAPAVIVTLQAGLSLSIIELLQRLQDVFLQGTGYCSVYRYLSSDTVLITKTSSEISLKSALNNINSFCWLEHVYKAEANSVL